MRDTIVLPKINYRLISPATPQGITEHKVLFIGQKTAAGTATAGTLQQLVLDEADINTRFGARSMLAQTLRVARKINQETQFDAIALDDNGVTKATAVIAFAGAATASGTLKFEICSATDYVYEVDVASGDTAAVIGTRLYNLLAADIKAPFTAADNTTGTVTLTAANAGTVANSFLLRKEGSVAGLTLTLTPWAGGATDPVLTTLFDPIDTLRYQTIVWPGNFSLTAVTDLLDPRFNVSNLIMDGVAIATKTDTLANLKAAALAQNSQSLVLMGNKAVSVANEYSGSHMREMNDVLSACLAAVRSLRLNEGTDLSDIVVTRSGSNDLTGGISLATLPYFNTPFPNLSVPIAGYAWTDLEKGELEENGVSVMGANSTRNNVLLGQVYTTYVNDPVGNPDTTYHYLNTVDAASVAREYTFNAMRVRYVQSRLTNGDIKNGFSMENAASIRGFMQNIYKKLAALSIYQDGDQPYRDYDKSLSVQIELTAASGTAIIRHAPLLVGQLRALDITTVVTFER